MKASFLIAGLFLVQVACPQSNSREFYNQQFNWKITIPTGFDSVPPAVWEMMQNRGANAIEKTYDAKVENRAQTIFAFRTDMFNYFAANYQPFDTATDGNYEETFKAVNDVLYGTFEAQLPGAKLDSASSVETIGGLQFHTFKTIITIPGKVVIEMLMYSRLFGKYEFTVNIMTTDKEKQQALLKAWRGSTF